jgi:hypothetical protein
LVHLARIEHDYAKDNLISENNIQFGLLCAQSPGAASNTATGRGLSEVLAGVLIACGRVREWQVFGDVGRADGGQGGRVEGLRAGGDAVGLAGDGLGEQLDGEASVAGGVAVLGIGEDGDGFAGSVGGEGESGFGG